MIEELNFSKSREQKDFGNLSNKNYEVTRDEKEEMFFKKRLKDIKNAITKHYTEIEKLRIDNPRREVGGKLLDGKIVLHDESTWKESSVELDESWEELRKWGEEKGAIYFHTHPKEIGMPWESLGDIKCALYNLGEVIFTPEDVLIIMPKKKFDHETIQEVFQNAKKRANEVEDSGWGEGDAYETYLNEIQKNLPHEVTVIKGLNLEHNREKHENEYKDRAEDLNKTRLFYNKIFGKGKITYTDIAHEEAIKENQKRNNDNK